MFRWYTHPWVAIIVTFLLLGYPIWGLVDRQGPVLRFSGEVVPLEVAPGQEIRIIWQVVSDRTCAGTVQRVITDSHGLLHEYTSVPAAVHKSKDPYELIREVRLPPVIAAGKAKYMAHLTFYCNPMHWFWPIREDTNTLEFTVKDPTGQLTNY